MSIFLNILLQPSDYPYCVMSCINVTSKCFIWRL